MFDDFDDGDFADLGIQVRPKSADLVMTTIKMGRTHVARAQFNFAPDILAEIGGNRYSIGFAVSRKTGARAFRIRVDEAGRFEAIRPAKGERRLLRCPLPLGVICAEGRAEPEFFVDQIGKSILVEVPDLFLVKVKALPAPDVASAPRTAAVDDETRMAIDRRMQEMLTSGCDVPRVIGGCTWTPAERAILSALLSHPQVSREGLMAATADPEKGEDERDPKLVDVFLSKMRTRLRQLDVQIENIGLGAFRMPLDAKTRLRSAIAAGGEA